MTETAKPRESLASILVVERTGEDSFVAVLEDFWGASMTCDALARAALAAGDTCAGAELQTLHASFHEAAPAGVPLSVEVERVADTDQTARRRVRLLLERRLLCDVVLGYAAPRAGLSYQGAAPASGTPDPETIPTTADRARAEGWEEYARGPLEFRRLGQAWPWPPPAPTEASTHREWLHPRQPLPADARLQTAALVFASDFYSHWTASDRLGADFSPPRFTPLDHTLWIHRRVPWNGWWLLQAVSEVGHEGRLFTTRQLFTAAGRLIASAAQQGLYA